MTPPFNPKIDLVVEYFEGTKLCKKVICAQCNVVIFNLSEYPTELERDLDGKWMAVHLEKIHGLRVTIWRCDDENCTNNHLIARSNA